MEEEEKGEGRRKGSRGGRGQERGEEEEGEGKKGREKVHVISRRGREIFSQGM